MCIRDSARLHHGFQHRQHRLQAGQLLFVEEDVGIFHLGHHLLGVGDEVGRDVAAIELHAFDDLDLGFHRLGFFDRDDAFVADLLHRLGDHAADGGVAAVVKDIEKRAKKVSSSAEVAQVGTISANGDATIGSMIAKAMQKVGNEGVITVEEAKAMETEVEIVEGMQFDRGYISPYFVTNSEKMVAEMEDAYILLHEKKLSGLQSMLPLLEAVVQTGKPLLILSEDVEGEAIATLVVNKLRGDG